MSFDQPKFLAGEATITIEEFSKAFGIGRTKVYEEIGAGRLKAGKVGRRTIIPLTSAYAWLDACCVHPEA